jgi:hypothetical protein
VFAIEYYCTHCREKHEGRFFKKTSTQDLRHYRESEERLASMRTSFVPAGGRFATSVRDG